MSLCSAFYSSRSADGNRSLTCFWPALRAARDALRDARDATSRSGPAETVETEGSGTRLRSVAALLARLFAVLAVRRWTPLVTGDGAQVLAAPQHGSVTAASKAGLEGHPLGSGSAAIAAGFHEDGEQLLATTVLVRAELRLAQLSSQWRGQQQGSSTGTDALPGRWGKAADLDQVIAAAEDAQTLLDRRAAAALTRLLIDEPAPLGSQDEEARSLWLTLHGAIAHLRLQGVVSAACFRVSSTSIILHPAK